MCYINFLESQLYGLWTLRGFKEASRGLQETTSDFEGLSRHFLGLEGTLGDFRGLKRT
jgi:hypothetical protein